MNITFENLFSDPIETIDDRFSYTFPIFKKKNSTFVIPCKPTSRKSTVQLKKMEVCILTYTGVLTELFYFQSPLDTLKKSRTKLLAKFFLFSFWELQKSWLKPNLIFTKDF